MIHHNLKIWAKNKKESRTKKNPDGRPLSGCMENNWSNDGEGLWGRR